MNSSESIKELAAALAKAQDAIEKADKDKENPHFRSKYADLGNVVDAIKPALVSNGLAFTQICHEADNAAKIETIIIHSSGEWLSCGCISVPVSKNDAQGFGSALTYARRYSLSAAFGVAPDDDDGNAASKAAPKRPQQAPHQPTQFASASQQGQSADKKKQPATAEQLRKIEEICTSLANALQLDSPAILRELSEFQGSNGPVWLTWENIEKQCTFGWAGKVISEGEKRLKDIP